MLSRFERKVVVAHPSEDAATAAQRMRTHRVGCLVVEDSGQPVGIVTDRDLVLRVMAEGRDPSRTTVREVMTQTPATIARTADIDAALRRMREAGARRLPIVDDKGKITGIVTSFDLIGLLAFELSELGKGLEEGVDAPDLR